nr:MAG TPA: hypothetical protein [Bacteriophage sp.]
MQDAKLKGEGELAPSGQAGQGSCIWHVCFSIAAEINGVRYAG